jgi:UDP-glucose:(heptosyl)LPS alpha-1,3-glucosyltransferase
MQPLRLAIVIKEFVTTGGLERFGVEVATRLRDKGHRIDLYAWRADPVASRGMHFIPVKRRYKFSSVLSLVAFGREAFRLMQGRTYDVVHSHERAFGHDLLTIHNFPYLSGLKEYPFFRRVDQMWLSPRNRLHLWLEKRQMTTPCMVAVSSAVRDDLVRLYHPESRLEVIPPGVDTAWFHPDEIRLLRPESRLELGLAEDEFTILFVGSEFKRKGLDSLITALPQNARLLVVGRGDHMGHYRSLIQRCGAENRIIFTGLVKDVRRYYAAADVVVLPSRSEAFGMSILEGMASGLPPVVTGNTGVAGLICDNENGLCLDSSEKLGAALEKLQTPNLRKRLGEAARTTAENYTWDKTAQAYEDLYYQIARPSSAPFTSG